MEFAKPDDVVQLGDTLSLQDVVHVARNYCKVADLSPEIEKRIQKSSEWVERAVNEIELKKKQGKKPKPYYGINTGFGALAGKAALDSEYLTKVLSRNLIASHSVGIGQYFNEETVRAAMLLRANSLAQGHSGVRPLIIQKLIEMLNGRVYPAIPSKGSLGASGDLAPLSHLALVMCRVPLPGPSDKNLKLDETSGEAFVRIENQETYSNLGTVYHVTQDYVTDVQTLWKRIEGREAMAKVGGQIELRAKEGLALNNGATFSAAIAALATYDAHNLIKNAELALAMTLEAIRGFRDSFLPQIHRLRKHPGAEVCAANVLRYTHGSNLLDSGDENVDPDRIPPQDPYSVRCAPQVLGTVRDVLRFVQTIIETELNAATDNPFVLVDELEREYKTVSGGNFHGEPVAMAMDFLGIAVTELGNISERRIFKLTDYHFSGEGEDKDGRKVNREQEFGLPDFLIESGEMPSGLSSGFMIPQYTAAALVSDCKTLAHPDSVDSIPSSANQEDHVSMSLNAARHAREIVENIEAVIAIEFYCAAQALSIREKRFKKDKKEIQLGVGTKAVYSRIRDEVAFLEADRVMYPDIRAIIRLVRGGELVRVAVNALE